MNRCKDCSHSFGGSRDPLSDICDGCTCDPDTGWGGFTDNSINKHFNTNEEAEIYYENYIEEENNEFDNYDIM